MSFIFMHLCTEEDRYPVHHSLDFNYYSIGPNYNNTLYENRTWGSFAQNYIIEKHDLGTKEIKK